MIISYNCGSERFDYNKCLDCDTPISEDAYYEYQNLDKSRRIYKIYKKIT